MRSQILIVLLAAAVAARPVAQADSKSVDVRELEYSEIEALYAARNHAQDKVETRELEYSEIEALYAEKARAHDKVEARELQYSDIEALYTEIEGHKARHHPVDGHGHPHEDGRHAYGPPPHHHHGGAEFDEFPHPWDHHHGGPHHDILDNIIGFLTHQVRRSVPDASSRVLDGIRDFLSHETRDVHEPEHHHPRHPAPGHDIASHILEFFASAAK